MSEPSRMRVSGAQAQSDYLNKPRRSATEAALDRATIALVKLLNTFEDRERGWADRQLKARADAQRALDDIAALIGPKAGGGK